MFQEPNESEADPDRLRQSASEVASSVTTASGVVLNSPGKQANNHQPHQRDASDELQNKTSYSMNKQQMAASALHQHYLNYFNSNIPKEETKSQQRTRKSIFAATQEHPSQMNLANANQRTNHNATRFSNLSSNTNGNNSTYVYHIPSQAYSHHPISHPISQQVNQHNMSRSAPREESPLTQRFQQQYLQHQHQHQHQQQQQHHQAPHYQQHSHMKSRTHSTGALYPIPQSSQQMAFRASAHNNNNNNNSHEQHQSVQQDRDSEEITTTIKEELENDIQTRKTSELEAISSLERNLPIELSFLIRQQAHCMARMNYLDRQIRELKDATHSHQQQVDSNQVSSSSILNQGHLNRSASNANNVASTMAHSKNGNFILSDDSGGEYSRATISDDDELSSLLDQIAKSVRPERTSGNSMIGNNYSHLQLQQQRLASNCGTLISNQQQTHPPYAIINPNQLHHQQAVPIFVMGSPIAVAHPSSINSNILPGVHFQPEPRYNQYYEDFYYGNNINTGLASSMVATSTPTIQKHAFGHQHHQNGHRSQQFDSSISAIEQLVSQKEKRQIISQLKSADNWLRMRSSNQDASIRNMNRQQPASVAKQASAETLTQEVGPQSSDNKTAMIATASTSNLETSCDRGMLDQGEERSVKPTRP